MAASIAAVYPHMNHIGGDGFWLIREPSGRVRALMAAGRAGAKATPRALSRAGYDEIPPRGPLAALTVPGAVGGWMLALEAAKAQGGKLPLDVLLGGAIKHAREGYVVTRSQARADRRQACRAERRARLRRRLSSSTASRRRRAHAQADRARRHARSSRPCRARRFLSRRCRARDRRRSRARRQPGDARRSRTAAAASVAEPLVGRDSMSARSTTRRRRRRGSPR